MALRHNRGSFRHTLQTFNHSVWAAKNAAKIVKGSVGAARNFSKGVRSLRRRLVNGPKSDVVARVRRKTRGGLSDKYFNKVTIAGINRREKLAAVLKEKRAAPIREAQRARSKQIVRNVKSVTRSIVPPSWVQKKGKGGSDPKSQQMNRKHLADFLREARRKPTKGYGNRPNDTFYFGKKRKYQGPKI